MTLSTIKLAQELENKIHDMAQLHKAIGADYYDLGQLVRHLIDHLKEPGDQNETSI